MVWIKGYFLIVYIKYLLVIVIKVSFGIILIRKKEIVLTVQGNVDGVSMLQ